MQDPLYLGIRQSRTRGAEYDEFVDEFVNAVQEVFPRALLQFEDFANQNAFRLHKKYQDQICTFNDDIQGTASVTLAGLYSAMRITKGNLKDQRILFHGAGEAAIGIANLVVGAMVDQGLSSEEAMSRCWFRDSRALVESSRTDLQEHKRPFAHVHKPISDLLDIIKELKPTALIGVSGQPKQFTQEIVEEMARINERPIIFALSNPTSKAECTAEEAIRWTNGQAIFASGSPFDAVKIGNRIHVPGQGNNVYIFPGVGLGAIVSRSRKVTNEMFLAASHSLASQVSESDLTRGSVYPPFSRIREVSALIAFEVAKIAWSQGLAERAEPEDIMADIHEHMFLPVYPHYG